MNGVLLSLAGTIRLPLLTSPGPIKKENIIKEINMSKKTKLAFWIVSHCETDNRREDYVKSLQKYIPIDIYGKCGPFNTSTRDAKRGYDILAPIYKFYLAFENSNCHDYATEKFWKTIGTANLNQKNSINKFPWGFEANLGTIDPN